MQKYLLSAFLLFSTLVAAQESRDEKEPVFKPALVAGFNATQVDGDDLAGYRKIGLNAGGSAFIRLPKNFSVNFEILYSQKGSRTSGNQTINSDTYKLILDYVDVPVIFNYHDKDAQKNDVAIFGLGVIVNSLVRQKELIGGVECEGGDCNTYKTLGLEAVASVTFVFAKHFGINLRFTYSLLNIASSNVPYSNLKNGGQRNNALALRMMYFF